MNYYNEIKTELINNEIYKKAKEYSKNRNDLMTYYNVGKLLVEAQGGEERAKYGDGLIKQYSKRLITEVGKTYNERTLRRIRQYYLMFKDEKWSPFATKLTWSHYSELISLNDENEILYYINQCVSLNLSRNDLRTRIRNNEYKRLPKETKNKLIIQNKDINVSDFIKHPVIIKNKHNYGQISEKILKQLILEDIQEFMKELGDGFCFVGSEYKIKIGSQYNYIDLLLFNYKYNCFVVIELKITDLKKEHIGQIEIYMNYIDRFVKELHQDKTIGIIICQKDNHFIMEYCSDPRIYRTTYELVSI